MSGLAYLLRFGRRVARHPLAAARGFAEGQGDLGVTYDDDPYSSRSEAYDAGRTLRRRDWGAAA